MHFQTLGHNFGDLTWLLVVTWLLPLKLGNRSRISFFASLFASDLCSVCILFDEKIFLKNSFQPFALHSIDNDSTINCLADLHCDLQ